MTTRTFLGKCNICCEEIYFEDLEAGLAAGLRNGPLRHTACEPEGGGVMAFEDRLREAAAADATRNAAEKAAGMLVGLHDGLKNIQAQAALRQAIKHELDAACEPEGGYVTEQPATNQPTATIEALSILLTLYQRKIVGVLYDVTEHRTAHDAQLYSVKTIKAQLAEAEADAAYAAIEAGALNAKTAPQRKIQLQHWTETAAEVMTIRDELALAEGVALARQLDATQAEAELKVAQVELRITETKVRMCGEFMSLVTAIGVMPTAWPQMLKEEATSG